MINVSIIIPTYNSADYLPETIESVLSQDYKDIEIIVVDDMSTDNTRDIISDIGSDKIRYVCLDKNHGGPSRPRNIGVKEAKGEYIALCDSDDLFVNGRIHSAVELLQKFPEVGLVFTNAEKFEDKTNRIIGNFLTGYDLFWALPKKNVLSNSYIIETNAAHECLYYENYINTSGVTIRKSVFDQIGHFDESLANGDDRDMWFHITRVLPIGFIDRIGVKIRVREGSISRRGPSLFQNRIKVIEKQLQQVDSSKLRKRCYDIIASQNYSLGYHYQVNGKFKDAKKYYIRSLKYSYKWNTIKALVITIMGAKVFFTLKKYLSSGN
jgi:glycosyltransferase involved in cell wall biosynthesis